MKKLLDIGRKIWWINFVGKYLLVCFQPTCSLFFSFVVFKYSISGWKNSSNGWDDNLLSPVAIFIIRCHGSELPNDITYLKYTFWKYYIQILHVTKNLKNLILQVSRRAKNQVFGKKSFIWFYVFYIFYKIILSVVSYRRKNIIVFEKN